MGAKFDVNNIKNRRESLVDIFGEEMGDDLFGTVENVPNKKALALAEDVDIALLHASPENPFKVEDDDEMAVLAASIKNVGILNPILARPKGDGTYEIISGHRRKFAAQKIGLRKVPVVIREMSDFEARRIMVDLNLNRENIKPSEKANAIALKYFAIKRIPGVKSKKEAYKFLQEEETHDSAQEVANEMGMSARTIRKYVTLSSLPDSLLDKIDNGQLGLSVAEQVAYMNDKARKAVDDYLDEGHKLSMEDVRKLRDSFAGKADITKEDVAKALEAKPLKKKAAKKLKTVLGSFDKELSSGKLIVPSAGKEREETLKKIASIRKALDEYERSIKG